MKNQIKQIIAELNEKKIFDEDLISYVRHSEGSIIEQKFGEYRIEVNLDDQQIEKNTIELGKLIGRVDKSKTLVA